MFTITHQNMPFQGINSKKISGWLHSLLFRPLSDGGKDDDDLFTVVLASFL